MKKTVHYLILIVVLQCSAIVQAQWQNGLWTEKQAYNWYFGLNAGLNFETHPPAPLSDGQIAPITYIGGSGAEIGTSTELDPSSSSISDAEGNLLFYTNGNVIWNKNHEIMINGTDLICNTETLQSTIIVKAGGDGQKYYVFGIKSPNTRTYMYPDSFGLQESFTTPLVVYSEVDMSEGNGLGAVTENKNIIIAGFDEPAYGKISATFHADGSSVWVLIHSLFSSEFKAFLVSQNGVNPNPVVSTVGFSDPTDYPDILSQLKFSPDGTKIAKSYQSVVNMKLEIFDFNKATGQLTDILATLDDFELAADGEWGVQGLEFSPNSRFLYASGVVSGYLKQIDTEAGTEADIKASIIDLYVPSGDSQIYNSYMQLAPDGKIYLTYGLFAWGWIYPSVEHSTLNVINNPNNKGIHCGYQEAALDLVTGKAGDGTPVFIADYFASGILSSVNCSNEVSFSTIRIPGIESIVWDFGDTASGDNNTSTDLLPVHVFTSEGTYAVTATITSNGAEQTATTQITLLPSPELTIPSLADLSKCANGSGIATFNLTSFDAILTGQNAANFTVLYYVSQEEIDAGNPINTPQAFNTSGQVLYAVATNILTGCSVMIQFDVVVKPLPVAGIPNDPEQCGNTSGTAIFDLTAQTALILNGQSPAEFNVVYYTDAVATNEILQPEAFASAGQTIYAMLTNTITGCSASTEFELVSLPLPSLPGTTTFTGCSPFDLVTILGGPNNGAAYTYFENEDDALNNSNAIVSATSYIIEGNSGTVYIRVENNDGCIQIGELSLEAGDCFIPKGISPNNDSRNDVFDLSGFGVDQIEIFNRYGQEVYSKSNYMAEWHGQADNGNELPTGTYFYMMRLRTGESRTGWVYVNRED